MTLARSWIGLGAALLAGVTSLLPAQPARAEELFWIEVVQRSATVDQQTGQVIVTGNVTCSQATDAEVYALVRQPLGRTQGIEGSGGAIVHCDRDGGPFAISLFAYTGRFGVGRAVVTVDALGCDPYSCARATDEQAVRLTQAGH